MTGIALRNFETRQLQDEDLPTAPVAYTPSSAFKSSRQLAKPEATSLAHHFSTESRAFEGSPLKKTALNRTDFIALGTGRPTSELYPWLPDDRLDAFASKVYSLTTALNYGHAGGSPFLIKYLTKHVELVHDPPYRNWEICLTSAMKIALRIFGDRCDVVLTEEFTYPGFLDAANLSGIRVKGIEMDADGLRNDALAEILDNWNSAHGPKPKLLYTIPTGQNPTGRSQSLARRRAIYEVAERHDLIIIEDDPYYYLNLGLAPEPDGQETARDVPTNKKSGSFMSHLVPSYLTLDKSGRVIRLDSTAKILAPGLRAGWVTANERVISKLMSYHEVTTVAVSGMSQLMLYNLLERKWGHEGFFGWLEDLSSRYRRRRNIMVNACHEHLPAGICNFVSPSHGMFIWIKFDITRHPQVKGLLDNLEDREVSAVLADLEQRILDEALETGVQVTKGSLFRSSGGKTQEMYFRVTFAAAREDELAEGIRLFAAVLAKEFKNTE